VMNTWWEISNSRAITIWLANSDCRAITHDRIVYGEDVDIFRPERFLKEGVLDAQVPRPDVTFGMGRRICPGKDSAEAMLWIAIATILTAFELKGKEGMTEKDYGNYSASLAV
jgi:cytochrome P450